MEVRPKSDQTMLRYPECVWSRAEESEHIEIVGRCGKVSEDCGRCQKAREIVGSCGRHWKLQKMSEGVGKHRKLRNVWLVTEGLCDRSGDVMVHNTLANDLDGFGSDLD